MMTARRFLGMAFLALAAPASAVAAKIEVVPTETFRPAPAIMPVLQMPLAAPQSISLVSPLVSPAQAAAPFVSPAPAPVLFAPAQKPPAEASDKRDEKPQSNTGASLFDGSSAVKSSPPETLGPPDVLPEWPGRPGDAARIGGRTYVLGERLGEIVLNGLKQYEGSNPVYRVKDEPLVIKFIHPRLKEVPVYGGERNALVEMDKTPIIHSRLKAASADGLVLVKELVSGVPLYRVTEEGPLTREQRVALLDMSVHFVSLGRTADLNNSNLVWQAPERRWVLIDSGGFDFAQPWAPLGQILSKRRLLGIDAVGFLAALRKRLGPDSPAWRAVETNATLPQNKALIEDLHRSDQR